MTPELPACLPRKRVAIYSGAFGGNPDGAVRSLEKLCASLLDAKMDIGIWTFNPPERAIPGIRFFTLRSLPLLLDPGYRLAMPSRRLHAQLREFSPDIMHVAVPDLVGYWLSKFARREKIPLICSFHTDFVSYLRFFHLNWLRGLAWRYLAGFYNRSRVTLAPSLVAAEMLTLNGIRNVKIWSRGIDRSAFNPGYRSEKLRRNWLGGTRGFGVLYVGRLAPYKGLQTVVKVYRRFEKENMTASVRFVIVGDGPLRKRLRQEMPNALFTGHLTGRGLAAAIASGDALLFPSTTETFGNVVQEALASGIIPVVADRGGCAEIVLESGGGLICRHEAAGDFFSALIRLMGNPELCSQLRERGEKWVRNRTWPRVNHAVIEIYSRLNDKKKLEQWPAQLDYFIAKPIIAEQE